MAFTLVVELLCSIMFAFAAVAFCAIIVERAIYNIGRYTAPASKDDVSKLDKFLKTDD